MKKSYCIKLSYNIRFIEYYLLYYILYYLFIQYIWTSIEIIDITDKNISHLVLNKYDINIKFACFNEIYLHTYYNYILA